MKKNVRVITCKVQKRRFVDKISNEVSLEDLTELLDNAYSRNSLLAIRKDWNNFCQFCTERKVATLPSSTTAVRQFIEKESLRRKHATIKRYAVTIGLIHRTLDMRDPTTTASVRQLLASVRLEKKHDSKTTIAFNRDHLSNLTKLLVPSKHPRDIRNLAIYYIMFECMLKRSELRNLTTEDLIQNDDRTVIVFIGNEQYQLSLESSSYVNRWLGMRRSSEGPLFNAIDKYGNQSVEPLDDSSIYRILRSASDRLKLDVSFSGQSLRVGAVEELASLGLRIKEIQKHGRWKSAAMPYQYIGNRPQAALERLVYKNFKPWS